ncbi:hypothetical protein M0R45_009397 [Rubus argutus]|uniref:Uncharacterized protein n=1 Tax=Rubus argutus TaxID=59490 RepID=A0AAW1Y3J1_RUBAR
MDVRQQLYKAHGGVSCGLRIQEQRRHRGGQSELGLDGLSGAVMKKKKEHGFRLMRKTWMLLFGRCNASTIMCLEISLVTFLLQDNYTSGLEALAQTLLRDHRYCGHTPQVSTCISILEWIISELDHQFLPDNAYYFEMKDAGFFDVDWD